MLWILGIGTAVAVLWIWAGETGHRRAAQITAEQEARIARMNELDSAYWDFSALFGVEPSTTQLWDFMEETDNV